MCILRVFVFDVIILVFVASMGPIDAMGAVGGHADDVDVSVLGGFGELWWLLYLVL